jgi:hypothetical protein
MRDVIKFYKKQSFRTSFLALFATLCFVGSAIFVFDVDPRVMLDYFFVSLLGLGLLIFAALLATGLRILLRRWFG